MEVIVNNKHIGGKSIRGEGNRWQLEKFSVILNKSREYDNNYQKINWGRNAISKKD